MQRRQRLQRLDRRDDAVVDRRRRGEAGATVHHPVADGVDRSRRARGVERAAHRAVVVAPVHRVRALGERAGGRGRRRGVDGEETELHRRGAAVQREDVHPRASIVIDREP